MKIEELENLGRRAMACPGWRWMPGMKTRGGSRVIQADCRNVEVLTTENDARWFTHCMVWPPDLSDPATVGCLLALVLQVVFGVADEVKRIKAWDEWCEALRRIEAFGPSIEAAAALVAALEAAQ